MDCHVQNVDKQSDEQREAPHECHEGRLFIWAHLVQKSSLSALLCEITQTINAIYHLRLYVENTPVGNMETGKTPPALQIRRDVLEYPSVFSEVQGRTFHSNFPLYGIVLCSSASTSPSSLFNFFLFIFYLYFIFFPQIGRASMLYYNI